MRNRTYGGVRGRKTKVGRKLLRFPPTRFLARSLERTAVVRITLTEPPVGKRKQYDKGGTRSCLTQEQVTCLSETQSSWV